MNVKRIVSIFIIYGITSSNIFLIEPLKLSQYATKVLAETIFYEHIVNNDIQKTLDATLQILPEQHTINLIDAIAHQYKIQNQYLKLITLLGIINNRIEPRNFLNVRGYIFTISQQAIKLLDVTRLHRDMGNDDNPNRCHIANSIRATY